MFKSVLSTDYFENEKKEATESIIKADRLKYKPIFEKIKETLKDDNTVIFSDASKIISHFSNKKKDEDLYVSITIYSTHARRTTTMLTNMIHEHYGKFVQMRAVIPNKEYDIIFEFRPIVKMYNIDRYKKLEIEKLFNTTQINNLPYFPVEVELMDTFHKLYLPNFYDEWDALRYSNDSLFDIFSRQMSKPTKIKKQVPDQKNDCDNCKQARYISISQIKALIIQFLDGENYVLLGEWVKFVCDSKQDIANMPTSSIQIISENNIDTDYKNISAFLSKFMKNAIFYKKRKLYIPKNSRITRYSFYARYPTIGKSGINKLFMEIYNCGLYELIPYNNIVKNSVKINVGISPVCLYFLFIDLWLVKLLHRINIISDNTHLSQCDKIYSLIKWTKKKLPIYSDKYMGINYDEKIEQKIILSKSQVKRSSYYPELSMRLDKKYKLIATSS